MLKQNDIINLINLIVGIENELFVVQCIQLVEYLENLKLSNKLNNYMVLYKLPITSSLVLICQYFHIELKEVHYLPEDCLFMVYKKSWFYE